MRRESNSIIPVAEIFRISMRKMAHDRQEMDVEKLAGMVWLTDWPQIDDQFVRTSVFLSVGRMARLRLGACVWMISNQHLPNALPLGMTEGCSGAEIASICREAGLTAMRENPATTHVCFKHFQQVS